MVFLFYVLYDRLIKRKGYSTMKKLFTMAVTATLCLLLLLVTPSSVSFAENSCAESPVSDVRSQLEAESSLPVRMGSVLPVLRSSSCQAP